METAFEKQQRRQRRMRQLNRIEAAPFLNEALHRQAVISRRIAALGGLQESLDQLKRELRDEATEMELQALHLLRPNASNLPGGWTAVVVKQPLTFWLLAAALPNGTIASIIDGKTSFALGRWTRAIRGGASWPPLACCIRCYASEEEASAAVFPRDSVALHAPRVLLRVLACGPGYYQQGEAWALSNLRVQAILHPWATDRWPEDPVWSWDA